MSLVNGRRALVTGGAMGIGRAVVDRLTAEGATVGVIDVEAQPAESVARSWVTHDLADAGGLQAAVEQIESELGPLDVLVNCAGIPAGAGVLEFERDEWRRVLAVNLDAPVFLMQIVARDMVERGYGRIVNVTSVHARLGAVGTVAYDVAKAGLENATRSFGVELAAKGVAVNAVAPGFVRTRLADLDSDWFHNDYLRSARLPAGRGAEPEEIAAHVTWLASEAAGYVSGSVLTVDGGLTATF